MTLDQLIAELIAKRVEVGGDAPVEAISVNENTAHPNDGGGCWPEWESHVPVTVDNGTVKIGQWDSYYST